MPIVLSIYNTFSKFQANRTLKITSFQPKLESQARNSPHFNSQFDPPHLHTQTFQVSTIKEYDFPKTTIQSPKTQKQHSENKNSTHLNSTQDVSIPSLKIN